MLYLRKIFPALCLFFICHSPFSQPPRFSLATDFSVLRSFKKQQQFWAIGQTVAGHFHFTTRDGAYAWLAYFTKGRFTNQLTAEARSPATAPGEIIYSNKSKLTFKHISLGWKHYFKGGFDIEKGWSLYGLAGFGLMLGQVENIYLEKVDTSLYRPAVLSGKGFFKRLTFDLGGGFEKPLGGDIFFYMEGRAPVTMTDYPSNYLFVNRYAPMTASVDLGLRILF